jgi:hypothetical protein
LTSARSRAGREPVVGIVVALLRGRDSFESLSYTVLSSRASAEVGFAQLGRGATFLRAVPGFLRPAVVFGERLRGRNARAECGPRARSCAITTCAVVAGNVIVGASTGVAQVRGGDRRVAIALALAGVRYVLAVERRHGFATTGPSFPAIISPGDAVVVAGTHSFCAIGNDGGGKGPFVVCEEARGLASGRNLAPIDRSYGLVIEQSGVTVVRLGPSGSPQTTVFSVANHRPLGTPIVPKRSARRPRGIIVRPRFQGGIEALGVVAGSDLVCTVQTSTSRRVRIGCYEANARLDPLAGTYGAWVSDASVEVDRFGAQGFRPVFARPQPRF